MTHGPDLQRGLAAPHFLDALGLAAFNRCKDAGFQVPKQLTGSGLSQWQQTLACRELPKKRLVQVSGAHQVRIQRERPAHQTEGNAKMAFILGEGLIQ